MNLKVGAGERKPAFIDDFLVSLSSLGVNVNDLTHDIDSKYEDALYPCFVQDAALMFINYK